MFQILEYMAKMIEADNKEDFFSILKTLDLEMKEDYMTLAQAWENDGLQKGIQQGMHIGELNTALKLLKKGYTLNETSEMLDIPKEEIENFLKENKINII